MRVTIALLLLSAGLLTAADTSQWNAVLDLQKGGRVGVVQMDGKRVEGRFDSASSDAITVDGVTVAKDRVARVYRRSRVNRTLRLVIGAGVGAAIGAAVDGTAGTALRNEGHGPGAGVITGLSAAAGAGLGAASGSGYTTVYQRVK